MVNAGYPPEILKKLQAREIELLRVVAQLCEDHNLVYFIDSGTCLGAVRHGGFIPWDDDIDIGMPLNDYFEFLQIAPKYLPLGYSVHSSENTENFTALWAKVYIDGTRFEDNNAVEANTYQGIFLDVFPYSQLEKDPYRAKLQKRKSAFWQKISYIKGFSNPNIPSHIHFRSLVQALIAITHILLKLIPQKMIVKAFWKGAKAQVLSDNWFCPPSSTQTTFVKSTLFPTKEITFAGLRVQAPADLDTYLSSIYGDYMQLPPKDKRRSHVPQVLDFGDGINVMQ
ncbi:LICD family protein [Varibaculum cambriense]|uniref:LICD family protein n=1 Tax=Varibaculum cambriense TaxID=184870 RepID=A0AB34WXZ1_9ACTO|nr:LicD family protein [Varibaculum cambriense]KXB79675.1 LICD family protein [Varibaculum cambriense]